MKTKFILFVCFFFLSNAIQAQNAPVFEHSMWQWYTAANVSEKRMNEIAPHFPKAPDFSYNMEVYDFEIEKWKRLYCFEYEAFINAPEFTKLNPYYTGYIDIVQMPYFIRPLSSSDKPTMKKTGNEKEDKLNYELDLQAWYFVFQPTLFYKIYEIKPQFPAWFDEETYRANIIKKIEASKEAAKNK
jgi:hypothetical protein